MQSGLPKNLWSYAVIHAVFLINRQLPSKLLSNCCPYQLLYGSLPDIDNIKVFGSLCYLSSLTSHRSKFDAWARKCAFLGHKAGVKGFLAYDVHSKQIVPSRNVTFHELTFCLGMQNC